MSLMSKTDFRTIEGALEDTLTSHLEACGGYFEALNNRDFKVKDDRELEEIHLAAESVCETASTLAKVRQARELEYGSRKNLLNTDTREEPFGTQAAYDAAKSDGAANMLISTNLVIEMVEQLRGNQ